MVQACGTMESVVTPSSKRSAFQKRVSATCASGSGQRKRTRGTTTRRVDQPARRRATVLRAERLLRTELGYLYHASFDEPGAAKRILRPPLADPDLVRGRRPPAGADSYLARLYEVPLLTPEQETYLFRKMNYLKFCADRLRRKINPRTATDAQLDKIEDLHSESQRVRNQIIEANLRLVFSLAKRYASAGSAAFDDFMGDGHITLMRAVEKFDFSRGVKFSTYATWAVVNGCNALLKKEKLTNCQLFGQSVDAVEDCVADHRATADEERSVQEIRRAVGELLLGLNSREQAIIRARFGFDLHDAPTLKELGEGLGISKERVRQLQQRALEKLRTMAEQRRVELPEPDLTAE